MKIRLNKIVKIDKARSSKDHRKKVTKVIASYYSVEEPFYEYRKGFEFPIGTKPEIPEIIEIKGA